MNKKLNRKDAFRLMRSGWVLEHCQGSTLTTPDWWWVREKPGSHITKHVHANAAKSLVKNNLIEMVRVSNRKAHWRIKP